MHSLLTRSGLNTTKTLVTAAILGAGLLMFAAVASAGVGLGVAPDFPTSVTVGNNNVPVSLSITNNSNSGDGNPLTLNSIKLIPSCGAITGVSCSTPDTGVFSVDPAGTGAGSCAANTFTITQTDGTTGEVTFTPNAAIALTPTQTCTINFTVDVVGAPDTDATGAPGLQTLQLANVTATDQNSQPGSGFGSDTTTVNKVSPSISTTPSAGGPIGTVLNDTATLSGGFNPTGTVTFKLFPPADASCSGSPVYTDADGSAPYATSPGYTSLVAGTYHWTADYAGDASNNATSSGCAAEPVVINTPPSGRIIIIKQTTPDATSTQFEFDPSWGPNFMLSDGQSSTTGSTTPGTYSVAEVNLPANWSQTSATCSDGSTVGNISLQDGETVTCTFNNTFTPPASEWCSPGYWKNHPEEAVEAATAGGFTMNTLYSSKFGSAPARSPKGVKDGAPTSPTLLQVINNPQWYGGPATNNVADLLSDAHPDVDFSGSRIENCPLN